MSWRKGMMFWVAGVALLTGSVRGQEGEAGPPPASVRVGLSSVETVQNRWDVVGRLEQVRQSVVASEVSGRIVEVAVEAGDRVEGGKTVLARVDDVWANIRLASAQADVAAAHADRAEAQARMERSRSEMEKLAGLVQTGAARPREYDEARMLFEADEARLTSATARIAAVEAALQRTERELERLTIVAPFDGVVVQKHIEVGEWAEVGAAIVQIVSRGTIDAVIDVPERLVHHVAVGASMSVFVEALAQEVDGSIVAIVPQGLNTSRTFPVKIRLNDQEGRLMAGMSVTARVPTSERIEAVTVPRDAVLQTVHGQVVWAVVEGKAVSIPVEVMFGHGERYVVRAARNSPTALADNMAVVIEGGERLVTSGEAVMVIDDPTASLE